MRQPAIIKHALEVQQASKSNEATRFGAGQRSGRTKGSKNTVTAALVENELARIAFFDPLTIFKTVASDPTDPLSPVVFTLRALHEMPRDARACIASIKLRHENLTAGDGKRDQTVEIRFWDKIKALEICAKHLGYIDGKGGNISAKELLEFLEAGRRRNANRDASLVGAEPRTLPAGPVIDVTPGARPAGESLVVDAGDELDDDTGDIEI